MPYDLVIRNGTVIDGSGMPRYRADVGISRGRIATIDYPPCANWLRSLRLWPWRRAERIQVVHSRKRAFGKSRLSARIRLHRHLEWNLGDRGLFDAAS